jgi:hypothetical protein
MNIECPREQDVLDAVSAGRWPGKCPGELAAHVASCDICRDVAAGFAALAEERDAAWEEAPVPPPSLVWWRAQIRAREEAARAAARPIAVAQALAAACLVASAFVLVPFALPSIAMIASAGSALAAWLTPRADAVSGAFALVTGVALPILPFVVVSIVIAPILLYYALTED